MCCYVNLKVSINAQMKSCPSATSKGMETTENVPAPILAVSIQVRANSLNNNEMEHPLATVTYPKNAT